MSLTPGGTPRKHLQKIYAAWRGGQRKTRRLPASGCRASQRCDEGGILRCRKFTDFPLIPGWCPFEQDGPDWKPPATIDLNGPPRYARSTTDGTSSSNLDWRRSP